MKLLKPLFLISLSLMTLLAFIPETVSAAPPPKQSIYDLASSLDDFSILVAAIDAADPSVKAALQGKGQYTVFAPNNDAFVALLGELNVTADQLLSNQELVTQVLYYHVLRGRRPSNAILGSKRLRTLQGGFLYQQGGVLTDNNGRTSNIIATDIPASNGLVHVISRVVLP